MTSSEPNLSDYLAELRGGLRTIAGAAAVGGLLGMLLLSQQPSDDRHVATTSISITNIGHPIDLRAGAEKPEPLSITPSVVRLNSDGFRETVVRATGAQAERGLAISATSDTANNLIDIRVTAADEQLAAEALELTVDEARDLMREAWELRYEGLRLALVETRSELQSLLTETEGRLAGATGGSAAADYLIATGLQLREELDDTDQLLTTIERTTGLTDGGVQEVGDSTISERAASTATAIGFVVGAILGFLAAVGFLLIRRFMSNPVDSRGAMERCGVTCLAVTPTLKGADDAELRAVLDHATAAGPLTAIAASQVRSLTMERIVALVDTRIRVLDGPTAAGPNDRVVLIVGPRTSEDELRSLAFAAASVGATLIGGILTGVARRDLNRARGR